MAVQLDNGDIMLNMRDNRNRGVKSPNGRRVCVTSDLGKLGGNILVLIMLLLSRLAWHLFISMFIQMSKED